jgi:hypothetical protein
MENDDNDGTNIDINLESTPQPHKHGRIRSDIVHIEQEQRGMEAYLVTKPRLIVRNFVIITLICFH